MASATTTATSAGEAAVDEAVRIATDNSRRTLDTAQATSAASKRFVDLASEINRDFLSLWTTAAETSLKTTFEMQNAALASSQTLFETSTKLSNHALRRWLDVARQAQTTGLKSYQSTTKLLSSLTQE